LTDIWHLLADTICSAALNSLSTAALLGKKQKAEATGGKTKKRKNLVNPNKECLMISSSLIR